MHLRIVVELTGNLLMLLGVAMCAPLAVAKWYGDGPAPGELRAFLIAIAVSLVTGWGMSRFKGDTEKLSGREGFAIVTFGWIAMSLFGAIPFILVGHPEFPTFVEAFFESMSGFSTTGASIVSEIESLPRGILFWRSMLHWLGGMGVVVLVVAILPSLGAAGFQLMRAEVPGPDTDRLRPRIAATAKIMWAVYVVLSLIEFVLLWVGSEMDWFASACHTFGTLATGGFSTRNGSIGDYNSAYVEWVIAAFMLVGALNFSHHYHALRGKFGVYWRSEEARAALLIILVAALIIAGTLWLDDAPGGRHGSAHDIIRGAVFNVLTIVSTTGYGTVDFDSWPQPLRWLMLALMFLGGSSGSTAGSLKIFRWLLLGKLALRELQRLINPRRVIAIKLDGNPVEDDAIHSVVSVMILYLFVFVALTLVVAALMPDGTSLDTSVTSVAASIGCVGPGLDGVGSTQNYGWMPWHVKLLLCFAMLLGRLELVTVLVLLAPRAWRR